MKINTVHTYACEICGRTYFDEADALKCEEKCNKKKQETETRKKDDEAIKQTFYILKDMAKEYCEKYHKMPSILALSPDELEDDSDEEEPTDEVKEKADECDCKRNESARKKPCEVTYTYKGTNPIEELLREFKIF